MVIAWKKITKIVTEIYGGKSVVFEKKLTNQLKQFAELVGINCQYMAKHT